MSAGQLLRDAGISRVSGMNEEDKCLESLLKPTKCVCGETSDTNVLHRSDAPCYYKSQPAQPDPRDEAKPCERCAELEAETKARKQAQADLETYKGRCTDLEHQNERLNGENARLTEELIEREKIERHFYDLSCSQDATIAQQAEQLAAAQKEGK